MVARALLFIDGNNWYHGLKNAECGDLGRLDFGRIAKKLVGPRSWVGSRYYIGQVRQTGNRNLYAEQRRFLDAFRAADARHSVHLGRLEPRPTKSPAAEELLAYLGGLQTRLEPQVYQDLVAIGDRHRRAEVMVEKAVDVMLAVDLVVLAARNEFDAAYLLSADGDFTHAASVVREHGKKVFAVSAGNGAQLARAVDSFIRIDRAWLADCYSP
jgi:uncharacterized LabA/DUF88 family protein